VLPQSGRLTGDTGAGMVAPCDRSAPLAVSGRPAGTMARVDAATLLRGFGFVEHLSAASRATLDRSLVALAIDGPKTVIHRGELISGAYLVLEGALRVYTIDARGRQSPLYSVEANGACIFALSCAFSGLRYPAWVDSAEVRTRVAVIPSATYRALHATDPAVQRFTFDVLSSRIFDLMTAIEELQTLPVEQRLASFLCRRCDGHGLVRLGHAQIAAHLGTAREVVTRHLRRFEQRGWLTTARGRITVTDPVALAAWLPC
jgi:CRP/FNR family transcriptional regulator, anaerobic regulatory protein